MAEFIFRFSCLVIMAVIMMIVVCLATDDPHITVQGVWAEAKEHKKIHTETNFIA
jgi:hypothetical protein